MLDADCLVRNTIAKSVATIIQAIISIKNICNDIKMLRQIYENVPYYSNFKVGKNDSFDIGSQKVFCGRKAEKWKSLRLQESMQETSCILFGIYVSIPFLGIR